MLQKVVMFLNNYCQCRPELMFTSHLANLHKNTSKIEKACLSERNTQMHCYGYRSYIHPSLWVPLDNNAIFWRHFVLYIQVIRISTCFFLGKILFNHEGMKVQRLRKNKVNCTLALIAGLSTFLFVVRLLTVLTFGQ